MNLLVTDWFLGVMTYNGFKGVFLSAALRITRGMDFFGEEIIININKKMMEGCGVFEAF